MSKFNSAYLKMSERLWLGLAIVCIFVAAYFFITKNSENGLFVLGMTCVSGLMYGLRRGFRRKLEAAEAAAKANYKNQKDKN